MPGRRCLLQFDFGAHEYRRAARPDTIVGTTRFHSIAPDHRRVEIGYTWVGLPWQRTAVNTESKYLLLRHAFEQWQCQRVEFKSDAGNQKSRDAQLRIGATPEGVLRQYMHSAHRGPRDVVVYSIVSPEWPGVKASLEERLYTDGANGPVS